jgi:hypothetical protein
MFQVFYQENWRTIVQAGAVKELCQLGVTEVQPKATPEEMNVQLILQERCPEQPPSPA